MEHTDRDGARGGGHGLWSHAQHTGVLLRDLRDCQAERAGCCFRHASVFLDLGIAGGPILLGLAAQASGIPFAFGVAAAGAGRLRVDSGLSRTTQRVAR